MFCPLTAGKLKNSPCLCFGGIKAGLGCVQVIVGQLLIMYVDMGGGIA